MTLLNRALDLLSPDGGMLFAQKPILDTPARIVREFWGDYVEKKKSEGFRFLFGGEQPVLSENFAVQRNSEIPS